jgi:hypothetical protein
MEKNSKKLKIQAKKWLQGIKLGLPHLNQEIHASSMQQQ